MNTLLSLVFVLGSPATALVDLLGDHGWGAPAPDTSLDAVAAVLASDLAEGRTDGEDAARKLRAALAERRVADVHIYPFTVRYRNAKELVGALPALLGRLDRRLPPTHFGSATHGRGGKLTTTLLLAHRGVELDAPLSLRALPGDKLPVSGKLRRGYFRPRVLVATPRGEVRDRPAWTKNRRVEMAVYFDSGPGVYGVEVIADSQYGPVVLANHRVYVGAEPLGLPVVRMEGKPELAKKGDPAMNLLALINARRAAAGLQPLGWSGTLAAIAGSHAAEMAARRTLAHGSAESGRLAQRLRAWGVQSRNFAENLAEAENPKAALEAFIASPGHERNLLIGDLTHLGIGVRGRYFAVVLAQLP